MALEGHFCDRPFRHLEVHLQGKIYLCCPAWLPHQVASIEDGQSLSQAFNSPSAQSIRESIHDGSFRFCRHQLCPKIQAGTLPLKKEVLDPDLRRIIEDRVVDGLEPTFLNFCFDESCNLSCPSCRVQKTLHTKGEEFEQRRDLQNRLVKEFFATSHDRALVINITGSGDPFGSKVFRELLFTLDGFRFPGLLINLQTNGVLFTPKAWERMKGLHQNINLVLISFDAATLETYATTRRGGDWNRLLENVRFVSNLKREKHVKELRLDFVVQRANYTEMPQFVELARSLAVDGVRFSRLNNWGTWNAARFLHEDVCRASHREHQALLSVLAHPGLKDPFVELGNLAPLLIR